MSDSSVTGVELELDQLSPEALRGLVEEFVTREGTDYSDYTGDGDERGEGIRASREWTLEDKVAQVIHQLERGEVRVVFDLELGTASIIPRSEN